MYKNIEKKNIIELKNLVEYQEGQVVSKTLVQHKFRKENPQVPMIPSETEKDFLKLCKVFGPPSQHERWCCTIFKTEREEICCTGK